MFISNRWAPAGVAAFGMSALWVLAASTLLAASAGTSTPETSASGTSTPESKTTASASTSDAGEKSATAQPSGGAKKLERAKHETAIYVSRMHCAHCAKKIARKLYAVKGVTRVQADVKSNMALVTPQGQQSLDPQALWKAVASAGFKPQRLVGPLGTLEADAQGNPTVKTAEKGSSEGTQAR